MKMSKLMLALLLTLSIATPAAAQLRIDVGAGATSSAQGGTIRLNADGSVSATGSTATTTVELEGLPRNSLGAEIRTAADVVTDDDLDAYEDNLIVIDSAVADADSSNKRVAISYWHDGRFLGIFPVRVQSRTEAEIGEEETLTVTTDMPWWSFLVFGIGNVQGDVQMELQANGQFSSNVLNKEDPNARARALEAILNAHASVAAAN
jgi:hypothetical protein